MWLTKNLQVSFRVCHENSQQAPLPPSYWENSPGSAGVGNNDTFTGTVTSFQLLNQNIQVNKFKSFTNFAFKTVL